MKNADGTGYWIASVWMPVVLALWLVVGGCGGQGGNAPKGKEASTSPETTTARSRATNGIPAVQNTPSAEAAQRQLSELQVSPPGSMAGYSREEFPHWSDAQEYGWRLPSGTPDPERCDARDAALIRDGKAERVEEFCDVVSGRWLDPYSGQTYTDPSDIDIDHIVPLANAWRSGASSWDTAKRESFANVPGDLLSVDDGLNQSKGDKGPEAWKPPREAYWCTYSRKWIGIKHYWKLSVTSAEEPALEQMLGACGG